MIQIITKIALLLPSHSIPQNDLTSVISKIRKISPFCIGKNTTVYSTVAIHTSHPPNFIEDRQTHKCKNHNIPGSSNYLTRAIITRLLCKTFVLLNEMQPSVLRHCRLGDRKGIRPIHHHHTSNLPRFFLRRPAGTRPHPEWSPE